MGNRYGKGPAQRPGEENSQTASPRACRFSFTTMIEGEGRVRL